MVHQNLVASEEAQINPLEAALVVAQADIAVPQGATPLREGAVVTAVATAAMAEVATETTEVAEAAEDTPKK